MPSRGLASLPTLLVLALVLRLAVATSLSDFTPRTEGLTGKCAEVYNSQIPGCSTSDFLPSPTCSQSCLAGLVQVNNDINTNCRSASVSGTSIVGLFLAGNGIQVLCRVAVVTTTTGSVTSMSFITPTSTATSSSKASGTSSQRSGTSTASTSDVSSGMSSTTRGSTKTSPTSSKTQSTSTASSSISAELLKSGNIKSGGGSPIDNITNSKASIVRLGCLQQALALVLSMCFLSFIR